MVVNSMGLKGWIGFKFKMRKTSINAFQALLAGIVDHVVEQSHGDIDLVNATLLKIGRSMAETLLFEYSDKIGKHATSFDGFLDTFNLATKVMISVPFDKSYWDANNRKIVYIFEKCPFCENVSLSEDFHKLKYCNVLSGVFQHVLTLRGFESECEEVKCKTWGDDACVWELREV